METMSLFEAITPLFVVLFLFYGVYIFFSLALKTGKLVFVFAGSIFGILILIVGFFQFYKNYERKIEKESKQNISIQVKELENQIENLKKEKEFLIDEIVKEKEKNKEEEMEYIDYYIVKDKNGIEYKIKNKEAQFIVVDGDKKYFLIEKLKDSYVVSDYEYNREKLSITIFEKTINKIKKKEDIYFIFLPYDHIYIPKN